jgi:ferredoxin
VEPYTVERSGGQSIQPPAKIQALAVVAHGNDRTLMASRLLRTVRATSLTGLRPRDILDDRMAEVEINPSRCQRSGFCARVAPRYFVVGEETAIVLRSHVDVADLEVVREAEDLCPTRAIVVVDDTRGLQ